MLSVQECKQHLHKGDFTDEQVEQIRDSLYQLADLFIAEYIKTKKAEKNPVNHEGNHLLPSLDQRTG